MALIDRYGAAKTQRIGNDSVYGTGIDGDVTISGTVTLTKDMYYNNLTVPLGNVLLTDGFRIFVKNIATINGVIGVGSVTGNTNNVSNGTITSPGSASTTKTAPGHTSSSISYRIGGQGGGGTNPSVPVLPSFLVNRIESMTGLLIDGSLATTPTPISGGSKGTSGSTGTTTSALTNSSSWTGKAGGAGNNGSYPANATTVNSPGGKGNTGNVGTATGATNGTGGAGGAGGNGGPVVILVAKYITGSGTIMSLGMSGATGSAGNTGSTGTAGAGPTAYTSGTQRGTSGVDLNDGHQAPSLTHTNHHHYTASTHHGHHGVHTHHHFVNHNAKYGDYHDCCVAGHHHACCSYHTHDACCTQGADSHYLGGTGGAGGTAAPAVTGGAGKRGGAGGGGAVIMITESTPSSLNYDVRAGTTADSDSFSGSSGSVYTILNT
jgi:hypothetical protein